MSEKPIRILLVEDDHSLGSILKEYLEIKFYEVDLAINGKIGLEKFQKEEYDFCLLDIMMPVMDGFELAKQIRKLNHDIPILFLTAKSMREDRIKGFQLGADDYLTKPFSMEELILRITAILRRVNVDKKLNQKVFNIGMFTFDYNHQTISSTIKEIKLTTKETELLLLLCKKKNEVLKREEALLKIWGDDSYFTARSMDVFIAKLRKYLKEDETINIMNIHGEGYKLVV